jgi:hypothetical protein
MKLENKLVTIISVILNLYYLGGWVISYNSFEKHADRVGVFMHNFPKILSLNLINIVLTILTFISIILISRIERKNSVFIYIFLIFQAFFILFQLWQNL